MHRREFFFALRAAAWPGSPSLARAVAGGRGVIGAGAIGPVRFCRAASPRWVAVARQVCGDNDLIAEVDANTDGAVLLGSAATLAIDRKGRRLLP